MGLARTTPRTTVSTTTITATATITTTEVDLVAEDLDNPVVDLTVVESEIKDLVTMLPPGKTLVARKEQCLPLEAETAILDLAVALVEVALLGLVTAAALEDL